MNLIKYAINEDYCIFFSADIVDSTKIKYEKNDWQIIFAEHYKHFINNLNQKCLNLITQTHGKIRLDKIKLWKINGDELLFYLNLNESFLNIKNKNRKIEHKYELVLWYVKAFFETIKEYNNKNIINVKGTIWSGNVPVENIKIVFNDSNVDFIGKKIDIGFRLSKYSIKEKLIISIEVAIILMRDNLETLEKNNIRIFYDNLEILKGVLKGLKYPICWINMNDEILNLELKLNFKLCQQMLDIQKLLTEIIKKSNNQLHYPYIPNTPPNEPFFKKWTGYETELKRIKKKAV